ncbi:MAG: hypothetical protein H0T91_09370, partial [Propionibacteriaceae bacterium]|nr:hypothetical protein [Propionibacteriaceae bacterium]
MNANRQDIERVLRCQQGIITRRGHPQLADAMAWMVKQGKLRAVLPGVYAVSSLEHDPIVRMRAATAWAPEAVLIGAAAAKLTFWPDIVLGDVQLAVRTARRPAKGFATVRRVIAPEHVVMRQAMRCTTPALTALDLCDSHGGDAIDAALRSRQTTL